MWNCIEDFKSKLQLPQASYPCGNFSDTQILLLNSCEIVLKIKSKLQLSQASYPCGNFSDTQILLLNSFEIVLKISKQYYSCHKPVIPVVIFLTPKLFDKILWNCIEDYKTTLQLSQASYPCGNFSDTQILLLNSCEIVFKISKQNYSCHKPVIPVVIFLTPKFFY